MLEGLQQLIELQKLDDELHAREREIEQLPVRRAELQERRGEAEERADAAREALRSAESDQREAEATLQDQEVLKARLEGQQFQVKSNEAYTALLSEIERADHTISDCETRILEAMDRLEAASAALASAEKAASAVFEQVDAAERECEARASQLSLEVAELRQERGRRCAAIDGSLLEQYERIGARRRPAVVAISSEICGGCRVNIPPQRYIEILKRDRIVSCGNCHRILIHE